MTDNDKNKSIEYILAQGFVAPPTLKERIATIHNLFDLKLIFWNLNYSIIFAFVTTLAVLFLFRHAPVDFRYSVAVGLSPLTFLSIVLFAEITERNCTLYELKQTCRYTSRQITALRCICYSIVGVVFAVGITAFSTAGLWQFFRLLPLCLGGLFLFATIELLVIRFLRGNWSVAIFSGMWILANLALPLIFREQWETFLLNLPPTLTATFAIACALSFAYQTNTIFTEENHHVTA